MGGRDFSGKDMLYGKMWVRLTALPSRGYIGLIFIRVWVISYSFIAKGSKNTVTQSFRKGLIIALQIRYHVHFWHRLLSCEFPKCIPVPSVFNNKRDRYKYLLANMCWKKSNKNHCKTFRDKTSYAVYVLFLKSFASTGIYSGISN